MSGDLPSFLVIGAMKAGTTSLAEWLGAHPDVFVVPHEVHFFDRETVWCRGVDWYRSLFAGARAAARGESSPSYLYNPKAPERMAAVVPDARLVAALREPVDRAYSHWWFRRLSGRESRPFAVAVEQERMYLERGRYLTQLRRLVEHFPRAALHVTLLDDLREEPAAAYAAVCRHIGVDPHLAPPQVGTPSNTRDAKDARWVRFERPGWRRVPTALRRPIGWAATRHLRWEPLDPRLHRQLAARFAPEHAALEEWLGRDLSIWRR